MSKRLHTIVFLVCLLSLSLISGCYTVVMHQKQMILPIEDETGDSHSIDISNEGPCESCPSDSVDLINSYSIGEYFGQNSIWSYYYDTNVPWWISRHKADESAEDSSAELGDTGMRRFYGRRREALNNNNSNSSITTNNGQTFGTGAEISSFPSATPSFGGTVTTTTTTTTSTVDSTAVQTADSTQTEPAAGNSESQNKKRDFGVRKTVKKK